MQLVFEIWLDSQDLHISKVVTLAVRFVFKIYHEFPGAGHWSAADQWFEHQSFGWFSRSFSLEYGELSNL